MENFESSVGAAVCLWEKKDAIPLLLTEESVEEHKENNLPLPPTDSVYILPLPAPQSQATYNPLPVYILPTPAENPKPATPAPKSKSNPLSAMQKFKDLVLRFLPLPQTRWQMPTLHGIVVGSGAGSGLEHPDLGISELH